MALSYPVTSPASFPVGPYIGAVVINYSSDQTFAKPIRALLISTAGTLNVDMANGETVALVLPVGLHEIAVTKIYNSGSSSAVGVALY